MIIHVYKEEISLKKKVTKYKVETELDAVSLFVGGWPQKGVNYLFVPLEEYILKRDNTKIYNYHEYKDRFGFELKQIKVSELQENS